MSSPPSLKVYNTRSRRRKKPPDEDGDRGNGDRGNGDRGDGDRGDGDRGDGDRGNGERAPAVSLLDEATEPSTKPSASSLKEKEDREVEKTSTTANKNAIETKIVKPLQIETPLGATVRSHRGRCARRMSDSQAHRAGGLADHSADELMDYFPTRNMLGGGGSGVEREGSAASAASASAGAAATLPSRGGLRRFHYQFSVKEGTERPLYSPVDGTVDLVRPPPSEFEGQCFLCHGHSHSQHYCPIQKCTMCGRYGHSRQKCPRNAKENGCSHHLPYADHHYTQRSQRSYGTRGSHFLHLARSSRTFRHPESRGRAIFGGSSRQAGEREGHFEGQTNYSGQAVTNEPSVKAAATARSPSPWLRHSPSYLLSIENMENVRGVQSSSPDGNGDHDDDDDDDDDDNEKTLLGASRPIEIPSRSLSATEDYDIEVSPETATLFFYKHDRQSLDASLERYVNMGAHRHTRSSGDSSASKIPQKPPPTPPANSSPSSPFSFN